MVLKWYSKNNARIILTIVRDKSIILESFQPVPDEHWLIFYFTSPMVKDLENES